MHFLPTTLRAALAGTLVALALPLHAAKLGDAAAPARIKDWIKGEAVDVTDGKNVYVVEFWATWCGPCRTSIPHLTELQKKYAEKGVVVVGVSDETADKVKPFVEQMGDKMAYRVALDDGRKTSEGYMTAYGQNGIPTAFIVGKNAKVLWFGHPMDRLEETLDEVLSDKYDLAAAIRRDEARARQDEYQKLSAAGDEQAKAIGRQILSDAGSDADALCDFAFAIVANPRNPHRDFALAGEALDKAEKVSGAATGRSTSIRAISLFESGKQADGLALAKKAVELAKADGEKKLFENYVRVMEQRMKAPAPAAQ